MGIYPTFNLIYQLLNPNYGTLLKRKSANEFSWSDSFANFTVNYRKNFILAS